MAKIKVTRLGAYQDIYDRLCGELLKKIGGCEGITEERLKNFFRGEGFSHVRKVVSEEIFAKEQEHLSNKELKKLTSDEWVECNKQGLRALESKLQIFSPWKMKRLLVNLLAIL